MRRFKYSPPRLMSTLPIRVISLNIILFLAVNPVHSTAADTPITNYPAFAQGHIRARNFKPFDGFQTVTQSYDVTNNIRIYDTGVVGYGGISGAFIPNAPVSLVKYGGDQFIQDGDVFSIRTTTKVDASQVGVSRAYARAENLHTADGWTATAEAHSLWEDTFVTYNPLFGITQPTTPIPLDLKLQTHVILQDTDGAGPGWSEFNVFIGFYDYANATFSYPIIHGRGTPYWGSGEWTDELTMRVFVTPGIPYQLSVNLNMYAYENGVADG